MKSGAFVRNECLRWGYWPHAIPPVSRAGCQPPYMSPSLGSELDNMFLNRNRRTFQPVQLGHWLEVFVGSQFRCLDSRLLFHRDRTGDLTLLSLSHWLRLMRLPLVVSSVCICLVHFAWRQKVKLLSVEAWLGETMITSPCLVLGFGLGLSLAFVYCCSVCI